MKLAAILAKVHSGDPTAVNAMTAIEMATINGARAMSLDVLFLIHRLLIAV
jgi:5-methylthioadenosine/S-adenosylhomocysteine deaminase